MPVGNHWRWSQSCNCRWRQSGQILVHNKVAEGVAEKFHTHLFLWDCCGLRSAPRKQWVVFRENFSTGWVGFSRISQANLSQTTWLVVRNMFSWSVWGVVHDHGNGRRTQLLTFCHRSLWTWSSSFSGNWLRNYPIIIAILITTIIKCGYLKSCQLRNSAITQGDSFSHVSSVNANKQNKMFSNLTKPMRMMPWFGDNKWR